MYREVATQRNLLLIDHYPEWQRIRHEDQEIFASYMPDGIHLNAKGCAAVITPAIVDALGLATSNEKAPIRER